MLTDSTTQDEIQDYIAQTIKYIDELYDSYNDSESRANILIAKVWFLKNFQSHAEEAIRVGEELKNESLSFEQRELLQEFMEDLNE